MKLIRKCTTLFREIERLYNTQQYRSGDYCAKVRALHHLLTLRGIL